jgi:hypothetical protein
VGQSVLAIIALRYLNAIFVVFEHKRRVPTGVGNPQGNATEQDDKVPMKERVRSIVNPLSLDMHHLFTAATSDIPNRKKSDQLVHLSL